MKRLNLILTPKESEKDPDVIDIKEEDIDMGFFEGLNGEILRSATPYGVIDFRGGGMFKENAIFLSNSYDYIIGKDDSGYTILVPLKKK